MINIDKTETKRRKIQNHLMHADGITTERNDRMVAKYWLLVDARKIAEFAQFREVEGND